MGKLVLADTFVDTKEFFIKKLKDTFKDWSLNEIFPNVTGVKVNKEHPFAIRQTKDEDIFPCISVAFTDNIWEPKVMGQNRRTVEIKLDNPALKNSNDRNFMELLTAKSIRDKITAEINRKKALSPTQETYGSEEDHYFNETLEFQIWDSNGDLRTLLFKIVQTIILGSLTELQQTKGVVPMILRGTPGGLYNFDSGNTPLFGAEITLVLVNALWFIETDLPEITRTIHEVKTDLPNTGMEVL